MSLRMFCLAALLMTAGCDRVAEMKLEQAGTCRPADMAPAMLGVGALDFGPAEVTAEVSDDYGAPSVVFAFDEAGAEAIAALTADSVGETLTLRIDDQIVSAPRVMEPILGGQVVVSGDFTREEAEAIAIRFAPPCPVGG